MIDSYRLIPRWGWVSLLDTQPLPLIEALCAWCSEPAATAYDRDCLALACAECLE
jgi:hypothetical protein